MLGPMFASEHGCAKWPYMTGKLLREKFSEPQDPAPEMFTVAAWEVVLNCTCPVTPPMLKGARNSTQEMKSETNNNGELMIVDDSDSDRGSQHTRKD